MVGLTDSNGTLVSTYQYDPYGNLLSSTGSVTNPWRFASGYFDSSTGLYKYGTRYYNPGFGRWSQQDPLRGQLNDPTSLNRYLYAGDDPVNFTDPSGMDANACFLSILALFSAAIVGALQALAQDAGVESAKAALASAIAGGIEAAIEAAKVALAFALEAFWYVVAAVVIAVLFTLAAIYLYCIKNS